LGTDGRAAVSLRFEILGDVRVLRDGTTVDLGPAKQRAVLAVLLLQAGRPVPTHQIVDGVWGDDPPENGANVVQKYVAGLRRVLDPNRAPRTPGELLALTGGGYVLRTTGGAVDAEVFRSLVARAAAQRSDHLLAEAAGTLRSGLALWRGEALAGLTGPVFEAARTRLAEAHATAWETWAGIELERGQSDALIPDLSRLVDEFPLREGLRAELMLALHRAGRQAEALAVFRDAREYYLDEFGVEPGEKMQAAHRRILRGELSGNAPAAPAATPVPAAISPAQAAATPSGPASSRPASSPPAPSDLPPSLMPSAPGPLSPAPPLPPYAADLPGPPAGMPAWPAPTRAPVPIGQVLLAVLLPLLSCSLAAWVYFVIAAVRQRDKRQYITAGVYASLFVIGLVFMIVDPSPIDSDYLTVAEGTGLWIFAVTGFIAAFHGAVLATHSSTNGRDWMLREHARQLAAHDPAGARQIGIGRPDLPRSFDDGGLIDINHVTGNDFAKFGRLDRAAAHRIIADRIERGPFQRPEDLLARGLISTKTMRRLEPKLIAIPPAL
jgi:DNA-binding SARP family transcriptional activator